jgi:hypothetical protein
MMVQDLFTRVPGADPNPRRRPGRPPAGGPGSAAARKAASRRRLASTGHVETRLGRLPAALVGAIEGEARRDDRTLEQALAETLESGVELAERYGVTPPSPELRRRGVPVRNVVVNLPERLKARIEAAYAADPARALYRSRAAFVASLLARALMAAGRPLPRMEDA